MKEPSGYSRNSKRTGALTVRPESEPGTPAWYNSLPALARASSSRETHECTRLPLERGRSKKELSVNGKN
jgi:hypothetical protein